LVPVPALTVRPESVADMEAVRAVIAAAIYLGMAYAFYRILKWGFRI
jgi:hypothetical protein